VRFLIDLALAVVVAVAVGVGSAWYAVDRGRIFGSVVAGGWTAWPAEGGEDPDPYDLAMLTRTGEVPLGNGEGLTFVADRDASGQPLSGTCTYEVAGQTPVARLWTLTATDDAGRLMVNVAHRAGFHSREIVRRTDGSFVITLSASVSPGNWLPVAPIERVKLLLRLYDTPLTTGSQIASLVMPAIRRVACP
jgi:hypothetical protein